MNHREFFDQLAEGWDEGRDEDELTKIWELIQAIHINGDESILDVGAGTGVLFPFLKDNETTAVDISFKMLKKAREKFQARYPLVQADVHELPFDNEIFDRAVLYAVFPHLTDKEKSLKELYRVLKTNGKINIFHTASREEINHFHKEVGGVIGDDLIPDKAAMINLLENAGFKDIEILDLPDRYLSSGIKT